MSEMPGRRTAVVSPWPERIAITFVALSLLLLLVAPLLMARGTDEIRDQLEVVADPARELVTRVQFELAREMAALRGYLMTADPAFLERFRAWRDAEREARAELGPLARALGPETEAAFRDLEDRSERWHERASAGRLADIEPGATTGLQPVEQRLYESALDASMRLDQAVLAAERRMRQEIRQRERRGLRITLGLVALALLAGGTVVWFGQRIRVLAAEADRGRSEAERTLEELRRSVDARDRLVRGVTHDVKNPLGAADGYAELLELGLRGRLERPQAETVDAIRRSIRSALDIINDLLELARAEQGRLPVMLEDVSLNHVVERTVALHAGSFEATGMRLGAFVPPAEIVSRTDARRVEQILSNLLTNARKYARTGTRVDVRLEWHPGPAGDDLDWGVISVSDDGAGIPESELERIFLEFHRLDTQAGPGHGLGLSISRQVARQLGGDLHAASEREKGAVFSLRLPVQRGRWAEQIAAGPTL